MALVSKNIPNLINGVSQQPAALRLESQGEVQENGFSDVVDGLKKRPPTRFLKQLVDSNGYVLTNLDDAYFHTYKRSDTEQYQVIITSDKKIYVYDIEGVLQYESGVGNTDDTSYLPDNPQDITATSVADATFIVNRQKTVAMSPNRVPSSNLNQALVYLKSVNYGRNYTVKMTSKQNTLNPDADHTTVQQITTATNNGNTDTTNSDGLKVSSVISTTRNANPCLREEIDNELGNTDIHNFNAVAAPDTAGIATYDVTVSGFTLTNQNALDGKYTVQVNGATIPYRTNGGDDYAANGWHIINSTTIRFPAYAAQVVSNMGGGTYMRVREAGRVIYQASTSTVHGFISPETANDEPYFIINTPNDTGNVRDFDIQVTDDDGGVNLKAFKGNAKSFTDLPNQCENGFRLGVVGDNQKKEDDFHVVFTGEAGAGYWKETVAYNLQNDFDLNTMPHTLRQNADLSFTFGKGTEEEGNQWQSRKAGDDNTNPAPSFVGQKISDIFFHRNRLGVLAGENVIFSEASGYYNFWRTTVRTLLDSDPIDVAVSQNEVSELKAAVPIQDNLLLFSNLNQFTLSASQLLTPAEVTVDQSTKYECDLTASPVGAGTSVFFATKSGDYSGVREFFTKDDTEIKDAVDITSHVPEYVKGGIRHFAASSNEDMIIALTDSDSNECYVYKWYNSATERLQSSWSKWTFAKNIAHVHFNNADIYFTFTDGSYEVMSLTGSSSKIVISPDAIRSSTTVNLLDSFGGTDYDGTVYKYPSHAYTWAGWGMGWETTQVFRAQLPYGGKLQFYASVPSGGIQGVKFLLQKGVYPDNLPEVYTDVVTISGSTLTQYTVDIPPQDSELLFENIVFYATTHNVDFALNNIVVTANDGLVKGAEQDILLDHRKYILGFQTPLQLTNWGITSETQFIDHRGVVIGTGNSGAVLDKVSTYLQGQHNEILDHDGNGQETNEAVNNYVYLGTPYTFKYQMSEQVFKPVQGDATRMARFQLRKVSFNFNDTGYFEVDVSSTGRDTKKTTFTGRTLGQIDNLLGYSAVVQDGTQEVGIQSQADQTNITITNDTHLPCIFQSAEWEGFVTLRNQRL